MSDVVNARGSCLCGDVKVSANDIVKKIDACHCAMCRKWGGGPYMAVESHGDIQFEGESNISVFASSDWAERGFCKNCGTHLFYRLKDKSYYGLPSGLFDDLTELEFTHQIFIEQKPAFYDFANKTKNMTGAEVFAKFTDESGS